MSRSYEKLKDKSSLGQSMIYGSANVAAESGGKFQFLLTEKERGKTVRKLWKRLTPGQLVRQQHRADFPFLSFIYKCISLQIVSKFKAANLSSIWEVLSLNHHAKFLSTAPKEVQLLNHWSEWSHVKLKRISYLWRSVYMNQACSNSDLLQLIWPSVPERVLDCCPMYTVRR